MLFLFFKDFVVVDHFFLKVLYILELFFICAIHCIYFLLFYHLLFDFASSDFFT